MSTSMDKGRLGEEAARMLLAQKGMALIARNVHVGHDELDLILRDGEYIVFAEVKLRKSENARVHVNKGKQARMSRAALKWLSAGGILGSAVRFDVVEVFYDGISMEVCHIPDAFSFVRGKYFI